MKRILIGLIVIAASEIFMWLKMEPFWSWHTPIAWTGYIVLVDGIVYLRRGTSWLSDSPKEFALLAVVSFPLWLVFEFYNLFIHNWHYINLPESLFWRDAGYVWAFGTIWPAVFESGDLVASLRHPGPIWRDAAVAYKAPAADWSPRQPALRHLSRWGVASIAIGAAMLVWPIVSPSPYLAAPVWLGFIFLLDPLNGRAGRQSLTVDWRRSSSIMHSWVHGATIWIRASDRPINLMLGGLMCGFLWEFWNYWARTKWIYTVPILENVKLFEMPLPGYLGFPAFALECFTMYVTLRLLLGRAAGRPIAL